MNWNMELAPDGCNDVRILHNYLSRAKIQASLELTMSPLVVRPAARSDREAVFEISATVWDGHDYLPKVWDIWLQESKDQGFLLVGEVDEKVVAVQHTAIQPMGVAWMEGIRVHPDYRQRGFAAELLRRALRDRSRSWLHTSALLDGAIERSQCHNCD